MFLLIVQGNDVIKESGKVRISGVMFHLIVEGNDVIKESEKESEVPV